MKAQTHFTKFVSFVLTFALLLSLLPTAAMAGTQLVPKTSAYKGSSLEDLNAGEWVSYNKFTDKNTIFFRPVDLNGGKTWTKFTFTLELSQYVSLELYKIEESYLDNLQSYTGKNNTPYQTLRLHYKKDPTGGTEDVKEDFLGAAPIGYLRGFSVKDHVKAAEGEPGEIEDALFIEPADEKLDWQEILKTATKPDTAKVTADNLYAFGYTGKKYVAPQTAPAEETGIAAQARASMDDVVVQNHFIWDGTLVKDGSTVTEPLEDGYYVIVMTPKAEANRQFNIFLGIEQRASSVGRFDAGHYHEPEKTAHQYALSIDPVDLMDGSFSWDYTDMSLFGQYDLPFTRYYRSVDGERNFGFGRGWTTEYTASLDLQTLFVRASLPDGKELSFNINFDRSYEPDGDYTLAWNGDGYTLTNTYTND